MRQLFLHKVWGEATALLHRTRKLGWIDLLVVVGFAGLLSGAIGLAREWTGAARPALQIDLSPRPCPATRSSRSPEGFWPT